MNPVELMPGQAAAALPRALSARHILSVDELTDNDIELVMETAEHFRGVGERSIKKVPALRGKTICTLFYESSTRTRLSFEIAAKRLSADTVSVSVASSSVSKGESLRDTAKTLTAMGVDAIVLRHTSPGAAHRLTTWTPAVVLNAGDGAHQHPSQALLDLFALRRRLGADLAGVKVLIVGDLLHSRVARSTIRLLVRVGCEVVAVGPPTLVPTLVTSLGCRVAYDLDAELATADVAYMLRMQFERQGGPGEKSAAGAVGSSVAEYREHYALSEERLARHSKLLVMHPGPMNRGVEVDDSIPEAEGSLVLEQVESGLSVRMALLYLALGGQRAE